MIQGLDKFRQQFSDFTDHYVLIGGVASSLVMEEVGVDFRATKDLDIVLCMEALDASFARAFWEFVKAGGYEIQERSTGKKIFYRFSKPHDKSYPYMLELFSRAPDCLVLGDDSHLTPVPVGEDVSSLSAILLDADYYEFLHQNKTILGGISIVTEACLIPLKAKAWLDMSTRRAAGESFDSKMIKKHKNDIFCLFQIVSPGVRVELPDAIAHDLEQYLEAILKEPDIVLKPFGLTGLGVRDVINTLRQVYQLPELDRTEA